MKIMLRSLLGFVALTTLLGALTACNALKAGLWDPGPSALVSDHGVKATASVPAVVRQHPCARVPIKIGFAEDQSTSTHKTRVEPASPEELEPLLDLLTCPEGSGGSFGTTVIRDGRDNSSLIRLQVDAPPQAPATLNDDDESRKNPITADEDRNAYQQKMNEYRQELESWRGETQRRVQAFRQAAAQLLNQPSDARGSRVCDAVQRLDLFLSEPAAGGEVSDSILILHTDGISTERRGNCAPLHASASVLLVNGSGSVGALTSLSPVRFECLEAAVKFVARKESN